MWLWQNFENWMQLVTCHKKLQNLEVGWLLKEMRQTCICGEQDFQKWRRKEWPYAIHYEQVFGNVFGRRESKCCGVMMKNSRIVRGEQEITLQMAQQLKTKKH